MTEQFQFNNEVRRIIEESLGADLISSIRIMPYRDHADEPALSIGVSMKASKDIPDPEHWNALGHRLVLALNSLGSSRFPYLYFDAIDEKLEPGDDADEFEFLDDAADRS